MGEIQVGDEVFDENGHPHAVTAATPVMYGRPLLTRSSSLTGRSSWRMPSTCGERARGRRAPAQGRPPTGIPYWSGADVARLAARATRCFANRTGPSPPARYSRTWGRSSGMSFTSPSRTCREGPPRPAVVSARRARVTFWVQAYSRHDVYRRSWERITAPAGSGQLREIDADPVTTEQIAASLRGHGALTTRWLYARHSTIPKVTCRWRRTHSVAGWATGGRGEPTSLARTRRILDQVRADGYLVTHHASTGCSTPIWNRPSVTSASRTRSASPSRNECREGSGFTWVSASRDLPAAGGRFPQGRRGTFTLSSPPRARYKTLRQHFARRGRSTSPTPTCTLRSSSGRAYWPACSTRTATALPAGWVEFAVTNERLARDTLERSSPGVQGDVANQAVPGRSRRRPPSIQWPSPV